MVFLDTKHAWAKFRQRHPSCNLAIHYPGVQVDCDSSEGLAWAERHGVNVQGQVWVVSTARGIRIFYAPPEVLLVSFTSQEHVLPDLLAPGRLAVVPPSIHPTGVDYLWIEGHSPLERPLNSLEAPGEPLLQAWPRSSGPSRRSARLPDPPGWLGLVFQATCNELESRGHRLRQSARGVTTTCPFHDDRKPSLSLHPYYGWKCFAGCGEGRLTQLAARLGIRVTGRSGHGP